jgi:protein-S-isoprenylcysteine O-methyltransferase Ste14
MDKSGGKAMVFAGILFIVVALFAVAGIHFLILKEEKFLIIFYGESYTSYQKKVRRYF